MSTSKIVIPIAVVGLLGVALGAYWVTRGTAVATLHGHRGVVRAVAFSPDGTSLATAGDDRQIRIYDANTYRSRTTLNGHTDAVLAVAFAPDGSVVSGGTDHSVRIWDASGRQVGEIAAAAKGIDAVAVHQDGTVVASAGADGLVHLWQLPSRDSLRTLKGSGKRIRAVAFSPDKKLLIASGDDGTIRLWDWTTGRIVGTISAGGRVHDLAISSDGKVLAAAVTGGTRTWDLTTRSERPPLAEVAGSVTAVAFTPNGQTLVTAHEDGAIKFWSTGDGRLIATHRGHTGTILALAASPDGQRIASAGADGSVRIWAVPLR